MLRLLSMSSLLGYSVSPDWPQTEWLSPVQMHSFPPICGTVIGKGNMAVGLDVTQLSSLPAQHESLNLNISSPLTAVLSLPCKASSSLPSPSSHPWLQHP